MEEGTLLNVQENLAIQLSFTMILANKKSDSLVFLHNE